MKITVNGETVPGLLSLVYGLTLLVMAGVVFGFEVEVSIEKT